MSTASALVGPVPAGWTRRHLLSLEELSAEEITLILDKAELFTLFRANDFPIENIFKNGRSLSSFVKGDNPMGKFEGLSQIMGSE